MLRLWDYLIELLKGRRSRLDLSVEVQRIFQEMLLLLDSMEETKVCQPLSTDTSFNICKQKSTFYFVFLVWIFTRFSFFFFFPSLLWSIFLWSIFLWSICPYFFEVYFFEVYYFFQVFSPSSLKVYFNGNLFLNQYILISGVKRKWCTLKYLISQNDWLKHR